jgi:hypothetical protein
MKAFTRFGGSLLTPVAVALLVFIGCITPGGSSTAGDDSMMQAFQEYKTAWNSHDVKALVAFYGKNGTLNDPGAGKLSGRALANWLQGLFAAIPNFKVRLVSADPIGNHIAGRAMDYEGHVEQALSWRPAGGQETHWTVICRSRCEFSKVGRR